MIVNADPFSPTARAFCSSIQPNIPINSQLSQVGRREILYSRPWHRQRPCVSIFAFARRQRRRCESESSAQNLLDLAARHGRPDDTKGLVDATGSDWVGATENKGVTDGGRDDAEMTPAERSRGRGENDRSLHPVVRRRRPHADPARRHRGGRWRAGADAAQAVGNLRRSVLREYRQVRACEPRRLPAPGERRDDDRDGRDERAEAHSRHRYASSPR